MADTDPAPTNPTEYVEWALEKAGGAGKFQIRYLLALGAPWAYGAMLAYVGTFAASATEQELVDCSPGVLGNITTDTFGNFSALSNSTTVSCALAVVDCMLPRDQWIYTDEKDTFVAAFSLVCDRSGLSPLVTTLYFFGFMFGVLFWGRVSDRCGRRVAFYLPAVFMQLGVLGMALAPNYAWFAACRMLSGFGNSGFGLTSYVWTSEFLGMDSRSVMSWSPNVWWSVGQMLLSLVAWLIPAWRHLMMALFILGCMFLLYIPVVEESPKWLATQGRLEEAHAVLCRVAEVNGREAPPEPAAVDAEAKEDEPQTASPLQLLDPLLIKRLLIMCFAWFATSIGFFGLSMNAASLPLNSYWANVVSGLTCIPAYMVAGPMIQSPRFGRKGTVAYSFVTCGVCLILSAMFQDSEVVVIVLYYAATAAASLSFAVIYVWASELFPTSLRGTAMGIQSLCARIGAMAAPFVELAGGKAHPEIPLLLFAAPCLAAGFLCMLLPETLGRPLPGTLADVYAENGLLETYDESNSDSEEESETQ